MRELRAVLSAKGMSLIELVMVTAIIGIIAAAIIPTYSAYRVRVQRLNAQSCLLNLARQQELYFVRYGRYVTDLRSLGYNASGAASCANADLYRLTASAVEAAACPLTRCYQLSAIPLGTQEKDGALYLTYDAAKTDSSQRLAKERGHPRSGRPWN
jgi:type IV pilus assembly protein PilE